MSLEVALQENTTAIRELIAALANAPLPIGKPEPAKANKPAATKESAPKAAQPAPPVQAQPAPEAKPTVGATIEDARKAVLALSKAKGRDAAVAILTKFGADKVPALDPAKFPEFVAACHAEIQK